MRLDSHDLKEKLINYLYSIRGKDLKTASEEDVYIALSFILREIIGMNWENSKVKYNNLKTIYILSFEYLPGKLLEKNLIYLGLKENIEKVLSEIGYSLDDILRYESEMGIGHGGLGVICDANIDSLSTFQFPGFAYGMRYKRGLMMQRLVDGLQVEEPDDWLKNSNVWELKKPYSHEIKYKDFSVKAQAYDFPYLGYDNSSVNTLRLWDAEPIQDLKFDSFSKGDLIDAYDNYVRARSISEFLYPNDSTRAGKKFRLMQEYFYVSATMQDIIRRYFKYKDDLLQMGKKICIEINDTHPILVIPEFMNILNRDYGISFMKTLEIARNLFSYTNYTVLSESFEIWDMALINETIPQLEKAIFFLDESSKKEFRQANIDDELINSMSIIRDGYLHSVNLATFVCRKINSVSKAHEIILEKDNLKGYYKYYRNKFEVKNGGINHRRWLSVGNPRLSKLLNETIGDGYLKDSSKLIELMEYKDNLGFLTELERVKLENKTEIANCIRKELKININPHSIFDMQMKRFHEFKRQLLNALRIAYDYFKLKENSNYNIVPRTYFFGGKAAAGYYTAKEIIAFINALMKLINNDRFIKDKIKIVFIENYNVDKAEYLFKAGDINVSIATASKESLSLSTIKFMLNGAVTIGSKDGLNMDVLKKIGPSNFFEFGISKEEALDISLNGGYNAYEYYNSSPKIRNLINRLNNLPYSEFPFDFKVIHNLLIKYNDSFMVLKDFLSYVEAHEMIDKIYIDYNKWNQIALTNIAHSGLYSSDRTILEFADRVWRINNEHIHTT